MLRPAKTASTNWRGPDVDKAPEKEGPSEVLRIGAIDAESGGARRNRGLGRLPACRAGG
jgi:hypothetical protein